MLEIGARSCVLVSGLLGSIPFGWIIARFWGVADIQKEGSTNIGATNVLRTAGPYAGALTFVLDFLKGLAPFLLFPNADPWSGLAAVVAHCYTPWLRFRGGKGVSTILGVLFGLNWQYGASSTLAYLALLAVSRTSAIGSLAAMLTAVLHVGVFSASPVEQAAVFLAALLVLARHRANWTQLLGPLAVLAVAFPWSALGETVVLLRDFRNQELSLPGPARRVAALTPSAAEIVADLAGVSALVGAPEYSDLPTGNGTAIASLGPYPRISAEQVVSLRPDLVIASVESNSPSLITALERMRIPVLVVRTESLADVFKTMQLTAAALGRSESEKLRRFEKSISIPSMPRTRAPTAFVQVGWDPLVTVGKKSFIHDALSVAGAKNVFEDVEKGYPRPSAEEVVRRDPDVILICQLTEDAHEVDRARNYWKRFSNLKAVRSGKIHIIPGSLITKPGFRLEAGIKKIRELL